MNGPPLAVANTIFETAILACKTSMLAANFRWYDKQYKTASGDVRRYLKVTWDQSAIPEENEKNFNLARTIFWEHMSGYMYMTVVDSGSFAIAIREVIYEADVDPGY
jgi:hypothetical protein